MFFLNCAYFSSVLIKLFQQILLLVASALVSTAVNNPVSMSDIYCSTIGCSAYLQANDIQLTPVKVELTLEFFFFSLGTLLICAITVVRVGKNNLNYCEPVYLRESFKNPNVHIALTVVFSAFAFMQVGDLIGLALTWVALNISLYTLMLRDSPITAEATVKYFLLGAAATGLLFFGIFLHFVEYASADYSTFSFLISRSLNGGLPALSFTQSFAFICIFTAFLFKLGVFPFHFYLADIYEGVRTETLAIITIPVKYATYFSMLNFVDSYGYASVAFHPLFVWLGIGSLFMGSYGAFSQQKLRRFWAYSYLGSMGFVFLGFQKSSLSLCTDVGTHYFLVYLLTWFTILLLFLSVVFMTTVSSVKFILFEIRYVNELYRMFPKIPTMVRVQFHVVLLSLAGVPPTLGFFAKFFVLAGCMETWYSYLVLLSVLFILPLSAFNYLRLVSAMSFNVATTRKRRRSFIVMDTRTPILQAVAIHGVIVIALLPLFFYACPTCCDAAEVYFRLSEHGGFGRSKGLAGWVFYISNLFEPKYTLETFGFKLIDPK